MKKTSALLAEVLARESGLAKSIVFAVLLLILSMNFGCMRAMYVINTVPEGSPKGYVKFYYLKSEHDIPMGEIAVYGLLDFEPAFKGVLRRHPLSFDDERGLLFVTKPGKYQLFIYAEREPLKFETVVPEGMVVPIKFMFLDVWAGKDGSGRYTISYILKTEIKEPYPFKKD